MKKNFLIVLSLCVMLLFGGAYITSYASAQEVESVRAKAGILIDADTGAVVYEKAPEERLQIASMVKIMTLNIIFEEIEKGKLDYDTMITASEYATGMGGSQAFLDSNNEYSAAELIKSIIVASANDSCVAMAEHIAGSVPSFVEIMNEKASEWGLENTRFVNCTGLPASNQYSCAKDVSKMMQRLIGYEKFFEFSKIWTMKFQHPSGRITELTNTNKLVKFYNGCDGGKTGFTSEALSCLSATAKRNNTRLICVIIGSPNSKTRNAEVAKLLNFGFENYETKKYFARGDVLDFEAAVQNGKKSSVKCVAGADVICFARKEEHKNYTLESELFNLSAPIKTGDVVGELRLIDNGNVVKTVSILANEDVERKGFSDILGDIAEKW